MSALFYRDQRLGGYGRRNRQNSFELRNAGYQLGCSQRNKCLQLPRHRVIVIGVVEARPVGYVVRQVNFKKMRVDHAVIGSRACVNVFERRKGKCQQQCGARCNSRQTPLPRSRNRKQPLCAEPLQFFSVTVSDLDTTSVKADDSTLRNAAVKRKDTPASPRNPRLIGMSFTVTDLDVTLE